MTSVDLTKLIDARNASLWNEIVSKCVVRFEPSPNSEYACYSQSNVVTFFVPVKDYSPDSFTHELLHVYIRLKEVYIGSNLIRRISANNVLQKIFNEKLLEHISNCLDHMKMLPIYLQMGFEKERFILDFHSNKCTDIEIQNIERYYKIGNSYHGKAIETFIGKFFAVTADPNTNLNYNECLSKLKKIDEKLFAILQNFTNSWKSYDLDVNDIFNSYRDLVDKFYEDLNAWMTNKHFL